MANEFERLVRKGKAAGTSRPRPRTVPSTKRKRRRLWPLFLAAPLAGFTAVWMWDVGPAGVALSLPDRPLLSHGPAGPDRESASFGRCAMGTRHTCVIDGDTFWYRGEKIRIADINTPETSSPKCAFEAQLGERATRRLIALLNAGAFTLQSVDRDVDKYGRALRVVTRGGRSIGATLEAEGLAEHWQGHRRNWC
jgi:endonuclease YncB( thermonuclease family)